MNRIKTVEELTELYPDAVPQSLSKVTDHLVPTYRGWVEGSRFCILSTVGSKGVHGSPRGDDGPIVRVQDDRTLLMPDWRGNNRLDCLRDIVEDGRVALLFLVPGSNTTVRVNGRAFLTDDAELCQSFEQRGRNPRTVVVIEITEVYSQCAKALMRADIWNRNDKDTVPTVGDMMAEITKGAYGGKDYDRDYEKNAQPRMW